MSEITIKVKPNGDSFVTSEHQTWMSRAQGKAILVMVRAFQEILPEFGKHETDPLTAALLVFLQATEEREATAAALLSELHRTRPGRHVGESGLAARAELMDCAVMKAFVADTFNRLHALKEAGAFGGRFDPAEIHLKNS